MIAAAAPGAAIASNGAPESANLQDNPLTPVAPVRQKTRFSAKEEEVKVKKAQTVTTKQVEKVIAKPVALTPEEAAAAKTQAAPLGLAGDTAKKPAKRKKVKGQPKERLEDKPVAPGKPATAPVDQTVSPTLAPTAIPPATVPATSQAPTTPPPSR